MGTELIKGEEENMEQLEQEDGAEKQKIFVNFLKDLVQAVPVAERHKALGDLFLPLAKFMVLREDAINTEAIQKQHNSQKQKDQSYITFPYKGPNWVYTKKSPIKESNDPNLTEGKTAPSLDKITYQGGAGSGISTANWTGSNQLKALEVENSTGVYTKTPLNKEADEQIKTQGLAAQSVGKITYQAEAGSGNHAPSKIGSSKLETPKEMDNSKDKMLDPRYQALSGSGDDPKDLTKAQGWKH